MGCDIHIWMETKKNGKWSMASERVKDTETGRGYFVEPYEGRNYALFGLLAGVRGGDALIEPRGVPDDACPEYKKISDSMGDDGHSHSWLTLKELHEHLDALKEVDDYFSEEVIPMMARLVADPALTADDVRIVFFFDN